MRGGATAQRAPQPRAHVSGRPLGSQVDIEELPHLRVVQADRLRHEFPLHQPHECGLAAAPVALDAHREWFGLRQEDEPDVAPLDLASFAPSAPIATLPVVGEVMGLLTTLVATTPELQNSRGDVLVADARSHLPFSATRMTNHLNHAEALWDPALQAQVVGILRGLRGAPSISFTGSPAAVSWGPNRLDFYGIGTRRGDVPAGLGRRPLRRLGRPQRGRRPQGCRGPIRARHLSQTRM